MFVQANIYKTQFLLKTSSVSL